MKDDWIYDNVDSISKLEQENARLRASLEAEVRRTKELDTRIQLEFDKANAMLERLGLPKLEWKSKESS